MTKESNKKIMTALKYDIAILMKDSVWQKDK